MSTSLLKNKSKIILKSIKHSFAFLILLSICENLILVDFLNIKIDSRA